MAEVHHLIFAKPADLPKDFRDSLNEHWASIAMGLQTAADLLSAQRSGLQPTRDYLIIARRIVDDAQESAAALRLGQRQLLSGRLRRNAPPGRAQVQEAGR